MSKVNIITLCSGYGAQELALKRLRQDYSNFDFDIVAWSEIDKYAITAYKTLHPEYADRNVGDLTNADWSQIKKPIDLMFYSTPCQSVSIAGNRKGMKEGDTAASALIWHTRRAIETLRPKYLILENVAGILDSTNIKEFNKWQLTLNGYGYNNFIAILNSRDYCVPQNRERVFMVSILGDEQYVFPKPLPLEKRFKDILDDEVDEVYYIAQDKADSFFQQYGNIIDEIGKSNRVIQVGSLQDRSQSKFSNKNQYRVYSAIGICPTLNTCGGGGREPKIVTTMCINSKDENGKQPSLADRVYDENGISTAITVGWHPSVLTKKRIRKITPREALRLMDVSESDIDKMITAGISNSQLYKLAGNSIVVSCLYHIFRELFITKTQPEQGRLF